VAQATVRPDGPLGRIARMAARIFEAPMATVSVVEDDSVRFLASEGMDGEHPLREGDPDVRFCVTAPIVTADGLAVGRLSVLDRKAHGEFSDTRMSLLNDLAALAADLMADRTDGTDGTNRPARCQLGGTGGCRNPAETKVADSWGDSAWGCWPHAEDALINVVPVFLAHDSPAGLRAYRARVTAPSSG
jgi:phosphoserine phosphatase RsbU/P